MFGDAGNRFEVPVFDEFARRGCGHRFLARRHLGIELFKFHEQLRIIGKKSGQQKKANKSASSRPEQSFGPEQDQPVIGDPK